MMSTSKLERGIKVGFREQMALMRRQYRQEAVRLDDKIDQLAVRSDQSWHRMETQIEAVRDQLAAVVVGIQQVRADNQETARTMQGRSRLLEERFGKMLDLVEATVSDAPTRTELEELAERVTALERAKENPAA